MGKAEREKGKRFERSIANIFGQIFPEAKRTGWMQSKEKALPGANGEDIDVPDVVAGPFDIETKHKKRHDPWGMMKQAFAQARKGQIPLGVMRRGPNEDTLVVMELGDFLELCRQWKNEAEK